MSLKEAEKMRLPNKKLILPELNFSFDALDPVISKEALEVHYLGHHKGYVDTYNKLLEEGSDNKGDLEFNFSGHILHSLYWDNLAPYGSFEEDPNEIMEVVDGFFFQRIIDKLMEIKGSGWLILDKDLKIITIPNHNLAALKSRAPILVLDGWEHNWEIDWYNNKKEFFINIRNIIDWNVVLDRFRTN